MNNPISQLFPNSKLFIVIFLLLLQLSAYSQGFDWQWTARSVAKNPKTYTGVSLGYGLQYLRGSITFLEDRISCPDFTGGDGNSFVAGVAFERWEKYNRFCIRAGVAFEHMELRSATIDYVPLSPYLTGEYETSLLLQHNQLNVHAGIKYRILNTHWSVGADLLLCAVASDSFSVTETILGPPEVPPFGTLPPSFSRALIAGHSNVNRLRLQPLLSIGYDIPLFRGTYIEPTLYLTLPSFTLLSDDNVRNYNVFFGVKVLTALW